MRSEIILIIRFKARARPEYAVNGGEGRLTVNWKIGTVLAQLEHTSLYIALLWRRDYRLYRSLDPVRREQL